MKWQYAIGAFALVTLVLLIVILCGNVSSADGSLGGVRGGSEVPRIGGTTFIPRLVKATFSPSPDSLFHYRIRPGWTVLDNRSGKQVIVTPRSASPTCKACALLMLNNNSK
jgi:hypothetical protein